MSNLIKKKYWVTLLVLGAVGCSKVNLPRIGEGGKVDPPSSTEAKSSKKLKPVGQSAWFERFCGGLPKSKGEDKRPKLAPRQLAEYSKLQEALRWLSPIIHDDPTLLKRAHERAFKELNSVIRRALSSPRYAKELNYFEQSIEQDTRAGLFPGDERDLETMLQSVLGVTEGSPCANAYLQGFYSKFVTQVDPFAVLAFGAVDIPAEPDTRRRWAVIPSDFSSPAPLEIRNSRSGTLWITYTHWNTDSSPDTLLQRLEQAARDPHQGIVLDLRYAGGYDADVIRKFRESAAKGWGSMPITLLTNYSTHGFASVFVQEMAEKSNILVLGTDEMTYGFARKLTKREGALLKGLPQISLTIGTEMLAATGNIDRDGNRVRIRNENLLAKFDEEEVSAKAERWAQAAPTAHADQPVAPPVQEAPVQVMPGIEGQAAVLEVQHAPDEPPIDLGQALSEAPQQIEIPEEISAAEARSGAPPRAFGF